METTSTTQPAPKPQQTDEGTLLTTKVEGEKKPEPEKEGEKKSAEKPEAKGPPEKYADFTVPEGYELDNGVAESAGALFKELGLSQGQAQKLIDYYSSHAIKSSDLASQTVKDMRAGWVDQVRTSDEFRNEFGADGKIKVDSKVLVGVGRMLDSLGDAKLANDFRQALDQTGAGDHPAVFRVLARLASHFAEGTPVKGNGPSRFGQGETTARRSPAEEIYPNLANKGT